MRGLPPLFHLDQEILLQLGVHLLGTATPAKFPTPPNTLLAPTPPIPPVQFCTAQAEAVGTTGQGQVNYIYNSCDMSLTPPGLTKETLKALLDFMVKVRPSIATTYGFGPLVRKTEESTCINYLEAWCQLELNLYHSLLSEFKELFKESVKSSFFTDQDFTLTDSSESSESSD